MTLCTLHFIILYLLLGIVYKCIHVPKLVYSIFHSTNCIANNNVDANVAFEMCENIIQKNVMYYIQK